jgi:hypothetical protein
MDWADGGHKARGALSKRGIDLLRALGFGIETCDRVTSILRAGERKVAVAVLLTREESPEMSGERFAGLSPISYALSVADRENLPWVVVQHGAKIRIHPARVGVGVGRRGRAETYVECHAGLLPDIDAAYLWLLCSADALAPSGSLEQILDASGRFAGSLAERLRERIYQSVVPRLAESIVEARGLENPSTQDLADTYEMALAVLFRLLFIAYAEDKDLLPYRWNGLYRRGSVYLHNASGARKSTGSYFTTHFAVEHLLERALEPALAEHLARLDVLGEDEAGEHFFDFRVADLAMGSGHFLVAVIDRIERALTGCLSRRRLPAVAGELAALRAAAVEALGPLADQVESEDTQLLRRLIARRCVYGVDLNPTAVQLARLSIWIHTFVPGLPLSLLDHNLVRGNSLVGIGRLEEAKQKIEEGSLPLYPLDAEHLLGAAAEHLRRLARIADATPADLARARKAQEAALAAVAPAAALFDIVTAARIQGKLVHVDFDRWEEIRDGLPASKEHEAALEQLAELHPFHFPVAFPEVFLRDRPGFDVIVGNPPWQEATLEEDAFWARHSPGLRSLPQRELEAAKMKFRRERPDLVAVYDRELAEAELLRQALTAGPYPGMGTGDPDLYKAFCWRFWNLVCVDGGRIGVVLPRSALAAKGSTEFRFEIFSGAEVVDITMLLNSRQWFFEDVHPQYTIGLVALARRAVERTPIALRGPYPSLDRYNGGMVREPALFCGKEVRSWNDTASLPLLPTDESVEVFAQLRKSPRLDLDDSKTWRVRPHTELHATNDKDLIDIKSKGCPAGFWPVYKGESFDLWTPDTGTYYAWADPEKVLPHLQQKRLRGAHNPNSPFSEFDRNWLRDIRTLPCLRPRIAFRDVSRATDSRTVRAALVPPKVFITNKGPYLLQPRGGFQDYAYILGVLSSIPLDWYARRFVEVSMNFFILNPFPIPRRTTIHSLSRRTIQLAGRLACPDKRFAAWAKEVGVACGPLPEDEKEDMIHELDAVVAHLYGLSEKHLTHIFETFHEGWDYEECLRATLRHFRRWEGIKD